MTKEEIRIERLDKIAKSEEFDLMVKGYDSDGKHCKNLDMKAYNISNDPENGVWVETTKDYCEYVDRFICWENNILKTDMLYIIDIRPISIIKAIKELAGNNKLTK